MAQLLVKYGDISTINKSALSQRVATVADLLGVGEWSDRTKIALDDAKSDPPRLVVAALCAPENLVSV